MVSRARRDAILAPAFNPALEPANSIRQYTPPNCVELSSDEKRAIVGELYAGFTLTESAERTGLDIASVNFSMSVDREFAACTMVADTAGARVRAERFAKQAEDAGTDAKARTASIELARLAREQAADMTNVRKGRRALDELSARIAALKADDGKAPAVGIRWAGEGEEGKADPARDAVEAEG